MERFTIPFDKNPAAEFDPSIPEGSHRHAHARPEI